MTRYIDESREAQAAIARRLVPGVGAGAELVATLVKARASELGLEDSGAYIASWTATPARIRRDFRKVVAVAQTTHRVPMEGREDAIPLVIILEYGAERAGAGGIQAPTPHVRGIAASIGPAMRRLLAV